MAQNKAVPATAGRQPKTFSSMSFARVYYKSDMNAGTDSHLPLINRLPPFNFSLDDDDDSDSDSGSDSDDDNTLNTDDNSHTSNESSPSNVDGAQKKGNNNDDSDGGNSSVGSSNGSNSGNSSGSNSGSPAQGNGGTSSSNGQTSGDPTSSSGGSNMSNGSSNFTASTAGGTDSPPSNGGSPGHFGPPGCSFVDESDGRLQYSSGWVLNSFLSGTTHSTTINGSSVVVDFNGQSLVWIRYIQSEASTSRHKHHRCWYSTAKQCDSWSTLCYIHD